MFPQIYWFLGTACTYTMYTCTNNLAAEQQNKWHVLFTTGDSTEFFPLSFLILHTHFMYKLSADTLILSYDTLTPKIMQSSCKVKLEVHCSSCWGIPSGSKVRIMNN